MTQEHATYGFGTTLNLPVAQAIERVTAALKDEGFGVLTTIDVQHTLKQKLDIDGEPYVILGACNPHLAHQALTAVPDIGLLLPCNVVVRRADGATRVEIADPVAMLGIVQQPALDQLAQEARTRLQRVLHRMESGA
ncbi:MAG TPA: DUF302 domain-containing protein [Herpetosiphonaceae bacterium]